MVHNYVYIHIRCLYTYCFINFYKSLLFNCVFIKDSKMSDSDYEKINVKYIIYNQY